MTSQPAEDDAKSGLERVRQAQGGSEDTRGTSHPGVGSQNDAGSFGVGRPSPALYEFKQPH